MTSLWPGGCACGAVRYEMKSEPLFQNHCHCQQCQKLSGTGHGSYLTFPGRAEASLTGEVGAWRVEADSGVEKLHAFCPTCGAPVWLTFSASPDLIAVHAASLDDPGRFKPQAITYGVRAHAWDAMDPALPTFERMPG